ncbi:MAG: AbrB/MazE/SpoVT family DNA-binding domain-containing protein [Chloroflexi bacterium]|nr:AbrB/MazE/SpoVT family DNA-binding domain-containing protein [Chloroflexota bacterium]
MATVTIQIRQKGVITLPVELRRRYGLGEGDVLTLVDLGDGSFLLTPRVSEIARLGEQVARVMEQEGVGLKEMLETLDEERERYYRERYAQA